MRPRTWAVGSVFVASALAALPLSSGCGNGHDRPPGHGDISFGIAPGGDELVFNAAGEGRRDLYRLDLKTHRVSRIAATPDYEVDPAFSPDGKAIVYAAGRPGERADHIFTRTLADGRVARLTDADANDASPAYSPDGSRIVFTRAKTYRWGGLASNWEAGGVVCVMKADGSDMREISGDDPVAIGPRFSADGATVLFSTEGGIFTVPTDGSRPPSPMGHLSGSQATYSPDGRAVAYSAGRYAPNCRIFVARADGTGAGQVTPRGGGREPFPGGGCFRPTFTPDGKRIVFFLESWPGGPTGVPKEDLWSVDLDGGNPARVAGHRLFDDPLGWRPEAPRPAGGP